MTGFLYRRAIALKELGERRRWGWLIRMGFGLREAASRGKVK